MYLAEGIAIFCLGLFIGPACSAGQLAGLGLAAQSTSVLEGHLSVRLPLQARIEAKGHSIMEAPAAPEAETRIVIDAGDERMVIMCHELFQLVPKDFEHGARRFLAQYEGELGEMLVAPLTMKTPGLRTMAYQAKNISVKKEANFLMGLLIAHPDSTVQEVRFFANPAGMKDPPGLVSLVNAIAPTFADGAARRFYKGGVVRIDNNRLQLRLPWASALSRQEGPDFTVYHVNLLAPLGSFFGRMGVYVGGHPNYQYRQQERDDVTMEAGRLLGREVEWARWQLNPAQPTESVFLEEVILPHPLERHLSLHVFITTIDTQHMRVLRGVAASLQKVE